MKTLVFVWTLKSVVAVIFFGSLILFVSFHLVKDYISDCIKEWRSKKDREEMEK